MAKLLELSRIHLPRRLMFKRLALFVTLAAVSGVSIVSAASLTVNGWPASSTAVAIDAGLDSALPGNEPSGLAWHSGRNQLVGVGDEGQVFAMNADGSNLTVWQVGGDLEDIAVADPASPYVYLADEDGYIVKYNLSNGTKAQTWDVRTWMPELACGSSSCGMEALTYANGYFYAGYQYNGKIYVFDLSGNTASLETTWNALSSYGYTSFSGLHYRDNYLYALYRNTMGILDLNGNVLTAYTVPGSNPEGLALGNDSNNDGDADMFIAQDSSGVYAYDDFPIYGWTAPVVVADPDNDGDGVKASADCNDSDASVSSLQTYYIDADKDGMGSKTTASVCSSTATSGYSSNSNDTNDTIPNAGVEISGDKIDNDGDGKVDEVNIGLHPYYSTLDAGASSTGNIKSVWGLRTGDFGVKYGDGSNYRYSITDSKTKNFSLITAIPGTAYYKITIDGVTYKVNGYTGQIVP